MLSINDFGEGSSSSNVEKNLETNKTGDTSGAKNGGRPHKCPQCPKRYKNMKDLTIHLRVHDEKTQFKCNVCHVKIFARKQEYEKHMLSHTGEKPHECSICNLCFGQVSSLKTHQFMHLKEKTFKCLECPVARYFQSPHHLRNHMVFHRREKQHKCSFCPTEFHRSSDLKAHLLTHSLVKAFECGICSKRLSTSRNLKRHIGEVHLGEKHSKKKENSFKCGICDKAFITSNDLKRHMKNCATRMEKRQQKCLNCAKRYTDKSSLTRHMRTHNKKTTN